MRTLWDPVLPCTSHCWCHPKIPIWSLMDFQYLAQAFEISDQICTKMDTAFQEFHDHKQVIITAGAWVGKAIKSLTTGTSPSSNFWKVSLPTSVRMEQQYNGVLMLQNDAMWLKSKTHCTVTTRITSLKSVIPLIAWINVDMATAIHEACVDFCFLTNDPDPKNSFDDANPSKNIEEDPIPIIDMTATLIMQIQPTTPLNGTIWQNADYFELAEALQQGLYPHSLLPFRTIVQGNTALHLARDPTMKTMSIEYAMELFNLPDLHGALTDFLTWLNNNDSFYISGHRISDHNSPLPFDNLQVWTKMQVKNCSYLPLHQVLPPQTITSGKNLTCFDCLWCLWLSLGAFGWI